MLMAAGASVVCDAHRRSPLLHIAARHNHSHIIEALLAQDPAVNVDQCNAWGTTALFIALDRHQQDAVQSLIKHGADVNRGCLFGKTLHMPLDRVFRWDHHTQRATVHGLLCRGAVLGESKALPLHHRAFSACPKATFELNELESLPSILRIRDKHGRTALHYAGLAGNAGAFRVLDRAMEATGVPTDSVDAVGMSAQDYLVSPRVQHTHAHCVRVPLTPCATQNMRSWSRRRGVVRVLTLIGQVGRTGDLAQKTPRV
jgi:ankyrin repeat protein